jgi:hypothetical protein
MVGIFEGSANLKSAIRALAMHLHGVQGMLVGHWKVSLCDHRRRIQPARLYHRGAFRSVGEPGHTPGPLLMLVTLYRGAGNTAMVVWRMS